MHTTVLLMARGRRGFCLLFIVCCLHAHSLTCSVMVCFEGKGGCLVGLFGLLGGEGLIVGGLFTAMGLAAARRQQRGVRG